jgi:hypothetical protein
MVKRSYIKEKELPKQKDFCYTSNIGKEFGENKSMSGLSNLGQTIITRFVKENEVKEQKLKDREHEIDSIRHSKPLPEYNPWKFSNHIIKEFSVAPADKVHSFKKEKKPKFLITDPFRRPKRDGDYIEKGVKLI